MQIWALHIVFTRLNLQIYPIVTFSFQNNMTLVLLICSDPFVVSLSGVASFYWFYRNLDASILRVYVCCFQNCTNLSFALIVLVSHSIACSDEIRNYDFFIQLSCLFATCTSSQACWFDVSLVFVWILLRLLTLLTLNSITFNLDKVIHEILISLFVYQQLFLVVAWKLSSIVRIFARFWILSRYIVWRNWEATCIY